MGCFPAAQAGRGVKLLVVKQKSGERATRAKMNVIKEGLVGTLGFGAAIPKDGGLGGVGWVPRQVNRFNRHEELRRTWRQGRLSGTEPGIQG